MVHASEFILLQGTKVGEKSLVLHTLSRRWGRRSFLTSVGRKSPMALFLPLSLLEGEVVENARSELWRLREISAAHPLGGIRGDLHKNTMTLFLSEVLYRTVRDGEGDEELYDWCRRSILTLDALETDFSNFHLRFLLEFATVMGFSPSADDLAPFAGEHFSKVQLLLKGSAADSLLVPMNGAERNEVASLLLDYIGWHTETKIAVRSLGVLRELYK